MNGISGTAFLALTAFFATSTLHAAPDWQVRRTRSQKIRHYSQDEINARFALSVRAHRFSEARRWLKKGADINLLNRDGQTLLLEAIEDHDLRSTNFLLNPFGRKDYEHGANPDALDKNGASGLMLVAQEPKIPFSIGKALIRADADVNLVDPIGMTALAYAARAGRADLVQELLKIPGIDVHGAEIPSGGSQRTPVAKNVPVVLAAANGYQDVVKAFHEFDPAQIRMFGGLNKETPLIAAARTCQADTVRLLLSFSMEQHDSGQTYINERDLEGRTAVMHAARECCFVPSGSSESNDTLPVLLAYRPDLTLQADPMLHAGFYGKGYTTMDVRHFASLSECQGNVDLVTRAFSGN